MLDADVFQAYIHRQAKDAISGLPVPNKLDAALQYPALHQALRFCGFDAVKS